MKRVFSWFGRRSNFQIGAAVLVLTAVTLGVLFNRDKLELALKPGETIAADFPVRPNVEPIQSKVKVAGVKVGKVKSVQDRPGGGARVVMKVAKGTRAKLGTEPRANARTLLLFSGPGRAAYVELRPGGPPGRSPDIIPPERTSLPVELYQVLSVLSSDVRRSLSGALQHLDSSLAGGATEALSGLVEAAPAPLQALTPVAQALTGEQNGDLARAVQHLSRAAQVLTDDNGAQLRAVLDGLETVAARLGQRTPDLTAALDRLPPTLAEAKTTITKLNGTLDRLDQAAPAVLPSVAPLRSTVAAAGPVLARARPVISALVPLLAQARPLLDDALPTVRSGSQVLGDLEGPVLDRLNSNVIPAVNAPYGSADSVLYQDIAYAVTGLDGMLKYIDDGGPMVRAYAAFDQDGSAISTGSSASDRPSADPLSRSGRLSPRPMRRAL